MFAECPPWGIYGRPREDNILLWDAVICGPFDTPFDGGKFKLTIQFSEDHPYKPTVIKFVSKMFHPNIFESDGRVNLDILSLQNWNPALTVSSLLISIQSLLDDPNPHESANRTAGDLFVTNKPEYLKEVRKCVERSWDDVNETEIPTVVEKLGSQARQDQESDQDAVTLAEASILAGTDPEATDLYEEESEDNDRATWILESNEGGLEEMDGHSLEGQSEEKRMVDITQVDY